MDVEKTTEFILRQQANAVVQMAAIRKLIQTRKRMIVRIEELAKKNGELIKEVAKAQKVTETKLQGLIDALRRGRNGNHRKN